MRHLLAALTLAPAVAAAQAPAAPPPVRPLGAVEARAAEPLGAAAQVRALPGGRVLVNDMARRRVLLFDSTLAAYTVVADTTAATGNAYSGRVGGLIPYRGDSTLFVDPQSLSMLVIAPDGRLGRTLSVPRPSDAFALTGLAFGAPAFAARGRLVYRAQPIPMMRGGSGGGPGGPGGAFTPPAFPDSAPVVRVDLATRAVDTAAFVRTPKMNFSMSTDAGGRTRMQSKINPLPVVDDWAVLSDGTLLVLRGQDFHADVAGADGRLAPAPRMPHEWQRLSDEAKQAFLDSTRTAMERRMAADTGGVRVTSTNGGGNAVRVGGGPPGGMPGDGGGPMMIVMSGPPGPPPRGGSGASGPAPDLPRPSFEFVPASELPDYKPPFAAGGTRADADGHAWVRLIPTTPQPGPVYAVVDRQGRLVDRVLLPAGAAIAGFGPGGVVYMATRDAAGVHLQRARVTPK